MYTCMCVHVWQRTCVCDICGGQGSTSVIVPQELSTLCFERRSRLMAQAKMADSSAPRVLYLPSWCWHYIHVPQHLTLSWKSWVLDSCLFSRYFINRTTPKPTTVHFDTFVLAYRLHRGNCFPFKADFWAFLLIITALASSLLISVQRLINPGKMVVLWEVICLTDMEF